MAIMQSGDGVYSTFCEPWGLKELTRIKSPYLWRTDKGKGSLSIDGNALIIPVALPEALERLRLEGDPSARQLPAHVTVHFPFADEPKTKIVTPELKKLVGRIETFRIQFDCLDHFDMPDEVIYYLKVSSTPQLVTLFHTIWNKFRAYPPYEGKHQTIVPHITLARYARPVSEEKVARLLEAVEQHRHELHWEISEVEWVNVQPGVPGCRILGSFPLKRKAIR